MRECLLKLVIWLIVGLSFVSGMVAANDSESKMAFGTECAACHGDQGEGNEAMNAPRIAGLHPTYLVRQLQNFQSGLRGTHEADENGAIMRAIAVGLEGDLDIAALAAYIYRLKTIKKGEGLEGNIAAGKAFYAICGACHQTNGLGNMAMGAPRLAGMTGWYLMRQLENFRTGVRGSHSADKYGRQMSVFAKTLSYDKAADIVAFIEQLQEN